MTFKKEADLCAHFIKWIEKPWVAYPETAGFDILLVHPNGYQIGVEAKLVLNAKVISQVLPSWRNDVERAPDYRAVLVPSGKTGGLSEICQRLGVTVLACDFHDPGKNVSPRTPYGPFLPEFKNHSWWEPGDWLDWCPASRCRVPDYIPDVVAGASSPQTLSEWKIRAIKIVVLLKKRGWICPKDFKDLRISASRWTEPRYGYLERSEIRGRYLISKRTPDFRAQHPVNFAEIEADYERWSKDITTPVGSDVATD